MPFTFEALPARYGDSLFLTFEDGGQVRRMLIDAGPATVYQTAVRKRLIAAKAEAGGELTLDAIMVSHVDEDHILGLLDLFAELQDAEQRRQPWPWDVKWLLHNSFDALMDEGEGGMARELGGETLLASLGGAAALSAALGGDREFGHAAELVLASYAQGAKLSTLAAALRIIRNPPDGSPILSADAPRVLKLGAASFIVVGPRKRELEKLRKAWDKWRETVKAKKKPTAELAATLDTSVPNLSSIVALLEHGGAKVLLTGDARSDYIHEGLRAAGLTDAAGRLHVDILKMPHHGSIRNVTSGFLKEVTADHYVASGDGTYGNPDRATLDLIEQARPQGGYTVHLTYDAETCDRTHDAWRRARGKGPLDVQAEGIAPVVERWKKPGSGITVREGPVAIAFP